MRTGGVSRQEGYVDSDALHRLRAGRTYTSLGTLKRGRPLALAHMQAIEVRDDPDRACPSTAALGVPEPRSASTPLTAT